MSTYCDIFKLSQGTARGRPNAPAYCGLPSLQCFSGVESERVAPAAGAGRTGVLSDRKRHGSPSRKALRGTSACFPPGEGTPGTVRTGGRRDVGHKKYDYPQK